MITDLAPICLNSIDNLIYPTLILQQLEFIFKDSAISAVIVCNILQLKKVLKANDSNFFVLEHSIETNE
jgi:long-subunit acyl-CoA synthetase (AMP-forming)